MYNVHTSANKTHACDQNFGEGGKYVVKKKGKA